MRTIYGMKNREVDGQILARLLSNAQSKFLTLDGLRAYRQPGNIDFMQGQKMEEHPRIAVFTGDLSYSVRKGLVTIDDALPGLSWLEVIHSPHKSPRQLLKNQWLNLHRNGWRWIPYQAGDILHRLWPGKISNSVQGTPGADYNMSAVMSRPNFRVEYVDDLHGDASLALVNDFQPYLGLSLAAPILRRSLFAIPAQGTLNLHKGRVPDYRGVC